jgi:hypothetical protein
VEMRLLLPSFGVDVWILYSLVDSAIVLSSSWGVAFLVLGCCTLR